MRQSNNIGFIETIFKKTNVLAETGVGPGKESCNFS